MRASPVLHECRAGSEATTVHLRRDDDAVYFAARCTESDAAALQRLHPGPDGHVVYDDRIGLLLLPDGTDQLVCFYVNPNGAVWDLLRTGTTVDRTWNGVEAAAVVDPTGFSVEAQADRGARDLGVRPPAPTGAHPDLGHVHARVLESRPARIGVLHLE